jgi:hypothetical protein
MRIILAMTMKDYVLWVRFGESVCVYVFGHLRHHVKVVIVQKEVERTQIPALATVTDFAEEHVQFSRQLDRVARSGVWC